MVPPAQAVSNSSGGRSGVGDTLSTGGTSGARGTGGAMPDAATVVDVAADTGIDCSISPRCDSKERVRLQVVPRNDRRGVEIVVASR
jgi:hypothetical protein